METRSPPDLHGGHESADNRAWLRNEVKRCTDNLNSTIDRVNGAEEKARWGELGKIGLTATGAGATGYGIADEKTAVSVVGALGALGGAALLLFIPTSERTDALAAFDTARVKWERVNAAVTYYGSVRVAGQDVNAVHAKKRLLDAVSACSADLPPVEEVVGAPFLGVWASDRENVCLTVRQGSQGILEGTIIVDRDDPASFSAAPQGDHYLVTFRTEEKLIAGSLTLRGDKLEVAADRDVVLFTKIPEGTCPTRRNRRDSQTPEPEVPPEVPPLPPEGEVGPEIAPPPLPPPMNQPDGASQHR